MMGASVGDNQAWIIDDGEIANLTRSQNRKPMLGSGNAQPVGFTSAPLKGNLKMISFVVNFLASSAQFKEKLPAIFFCPKVWRGGDPPART